MHRLAILVLCLTASLVFGDEFAEARAQLKPRTVTLPRDTYTVSDLLDKLEAQTGNRVEDRRTDRSRSEVTLGLERATFWEALEKMTDALACGYSPYHDDGLVLTDAPLARVPTSRHGIFQFRLKRVQTVRDFGLDNAWSTWSVEMLWEPRFEPTFYELGPVTAEFGAVRLKGDAGNDRQAVRGRRALELEFRAAAPPRRSQEATVLEGKATVWGPATMSRITFEKLTPITRSDPPIKQGPVSLVQVTAQSQFWRTVLHFDDPPIEGRPLESYQLAYRLGSLPARLYRFEGKRVNWEGTLRSGPNEKSPTVLEYYWMGTEGKQLKDWMLELRVPGPIVQLEVPFSFKDVPLP